MRTGDIVLVRHNFNLFDPGSWISLAIRKLDKTYYNHCGLIWEVNGQFLVVEARGSGIYAATFNNWLKHRPNKEYKIVRVKSAINHNLSMRIASKLGTSYDKESLFIWHPYRLLFGKWKGGTATSGHLVCSEFVGLVWKEIFPDWFKLTTGDIIRSGKVE